MKALLLTVEDGISPEIWLAHAKAYLAQNRQVMAITDADNKWEAVGTGDGLPAYGADLTSHPSFINRKVALDDVLALTAEIKRLPADAVVMWNMSLFEWSARDARWKNVLDTCIDSTCDVFFTQHAYSSWRHGHDGPEESLVGAIRWDYVAGSRISDRLNHRFARQMLPHLTKELDKLDRVKSAPHTARWEVISNQDVKVIEGVWNGFLEREDLMRSLASCNRLGNARP